MKTRSWSCFPPEIAVSQAERMNELSQRRAVKASDTRDRILRAAEQLFMTQGFQATSMHQITAAAEVNFAAVK